MAAAIRCAGGEDGKQGLGADWQGHVPRGDAGIPAVEDAGAFRRHRGELAGRGKKDPNFLVSESPLFVGRAIAALAADPDAIEQTGQLLSSWGLSRKYRFTDYDGRRPDWGKHTIDWSVVPPPLVEVSRNGIDLELKWLTMLAMRTHSFQKKIPVSG